MQKSKKYLVKKYGKSQFFIEILIPKFGYLENFQNFLPLWSKRAMFCMKVSYFARPDRNYSSSVDYIEFLYKFQSIFSKIFKNFHPISNRPRSKQFFEFSNKFQIVDNRIHRKIFRLYRVTPQKIKNLNF